MTRSLLTNIDFSESRNQLPNDKIIVGMKTKELVSKFTIQVNDVFLWRQGILSQVESTTCTESLNQ